MTLFEFVYQFVIGLMYISNLFVLFYVFFVAYKYVFKNIGSIFRHETVVVNLYFCMCFFSLNNATLFSCIVFAIFALAVLSYLSMRFVMRYILKLVPQ